MARITKLFSIVAVMAALLLGAMPARSDAQVSLGLSVSFGPPAIPVYEQPIAPGPNLIWQPGYWGYGPYGYYWVPGTWVAAPEPGLYWTPGYWGYNGGNYVWTAGYWGPVVGFYGGVNYGFGYYGNGYVGGQWRNNNFYYNTAVSRVNANVIHNTYVNHAAYRSWSNRVSYNGGAHGVQARPTTYQKHAYTERRFAMTKTQTAHASYAEHSTALRYNVNHGRPAVATAARPFTSTPHITAAHAAPAAHHAAAVHHAAPAHAAAVHHAAPAHAAAVHHAAPVHAAPVHHAAPAHAAAVHHAAPAHAAPVHHAAPAHAAPVHHAAPVRHAAPARPAYHPAARPAMHAAPRPAMHAAPRPAAHAAHTAHPAARPAEKKPDGGEGQH